MQKQKIKIANRGIGDGKRCFIIAEAGVNHNGNFVLAKQLIDAAIEAGADAVKFQTFEVEKLVTKFAPLANYQKRNLNTKSQYEMLKKVELSKLEFKELFNYCKKKKIIFLSTPFDSQSAEFLYRLGIAAFKIGSTDLTNIPLLLQVAKYTKPIILSTGMSTLLEVKETVEAIYSTGNKKLILLHCTSNYPTKYKDVNLRAMDTLKKKFDIPVGYSDHTLGFEVALAAVAMGACIIEKHFTLNKSLPGPDHQASLEPRELKMLVEGIRKIEESLGKEKKELLASERQMCRLMRKSIAANTDIHKDSVITEEMLTIKRPGTGLAPRELPLVLGKKAQRDIPSDTLISHDMLKDR